MIDGGALGWGDGGRAEPGESERGQKEKDRGNRDRQRRIGAHQLEAVIPRRSHIEIAHQIRSEEHTSELQSLMRISYAVFCLKKKKTNKSHKNNVIPTYIHEVNARSHDLHTVSSPTN